MRVDIRSLLKNPKQRRKLIIEASIAIQAREGRNSSKEEMEALYDKRNK